jgi:hypothetical protein
LRNLGLVNIFLTIFGLLLSFALFAAHRKVNPGWAGLALVISAIGGAVFFATNRCFSMLALSNRYAAPPMRPNAPPWSPQAKPCWPSGKAIRPAPSWLFRWAWLPVC